MDTVKTAVVILNWNGKNFLERFLLNVVTNTQTPETQVWVADNGSTDGSIDWIKANAPSVKILVFDTNYGFTGGYNKALAIIDAQYFVLLNSDVEVTPNWIAPVINIMDTDSSIAACMPKLLAWHNKNSFEYAGAAGGFIDKFGYPFCRGRILNQIETDNGQYNNTTEIFWATGACMFVRANVYKEMGGLDSDFFAHMEEIDLCWRMKNCGYKIMYVPLSTVYHVGGGTLPNNNPRKLYLNYRNNLFLLYKNLPRQRFRVVLFIRMLFDGASAFVYLLQGKWHFFTAVFKAHFNFYKKINVMRNKRRQINAMRTVTKINHIYNKSIVLDFFLRKHRMFSQLDNNAWK